MSMSTHNSCTLNTLHWGTTLQDHDRTLKRPWVQVDGCKWFVFVFSENLALQRSHADPNTPIVRLLAKAVLFSAREPVFPAWTNRFWKTSREAQVCLGTLCQGGEEWNWALKNSCSNATEKRFMDSLWTSLWTLSQIPIFHRAASQETKNCHFWFYLPSIKHSSCSL